MRIFFLSTCLLSIALGQISVSQIEQLSNDQLDLIRGEIQANSRPEVNQNIKAAIPNKVVLNPKETTTVSKKYFGYEFFQRSVTFYDNIPTPTKFKLGPGDEIVISLWGETNSREKMIINKDGFIYYKSIGFINLSNKTLEEAESTLTQELSKVYSTLKDSAQSTKLKLEVGKVRSINVYFTGQVQVPGISLIHPYSDIFSAIIQSGGIRQNGTLRNVQLIRNNKLIQTTDFYSFFKDAENNFSEMRLLEGDIIHVPVVGNRVQIEGEVLSPGVFELIENENYSDLIKYASGYTPRVGSNAILTQIKPQDQRESDDMPLKVSNLKVDEQLNNIQLNDGDTLQIGSIFTMDASVSVRGRVKKSGEFLIEKNLSLKTVLDFAGGFNDPVFTESIDKEEIIILRKDINEYYDLEFKVTYKESDDFLVQRGDIILVYEDINYKNSELITINGQVNRPGEYQYKSDLTINALIDKANGLTQFANIDGISARINGNTISNLNINTKLTSGMAIVVPRLEEFVTISGNIYNQGALDISSENMTIIKAVSLSGGFKPKSKKRHIIVKELDGTTYRPNFFAKRFNKLNPGDIVSIPKKDEKDSFSITKFITDISSTLANVLAIVMVVEQINDN
ncbi:SLBB domain-containing protein [Candidatus Marinimicrobia bacterium]|nr:SLBB domain-containing protein [Candidatus Neomarinimicrobiota bacterium]